jgi:hypothetical protein
MKMAVYDFRKRFLGRKSNNCQQHSMARPPWAWTPMGPWTRDIQSYRSNRTELHFATFCAIFATNSKIRRDLKMTTAVRVSEELVREAKIYSKIDKRSVTGQIEHWARIGKCSEENPDLTYSLIKEMLIGLAELEQGESSEYKFG